MALDTQPLVSALKRYEAEGGVWAELERATVRLGRKVSAATIGRTASGVTQASPSTWEALSDARPDVIPPPPWRKPALTPRTQPATPEPKAETTAEPKPVGDPVIEIKVFRLGNAEGQPYAGPEGEGSSAAEYVAIPKEETEPGTFIVRVADDSMAPHLNQGDVVVVSPSAPVAQGRLCLVAFPDDRGRTVRRYHQYGDQIVLRADNPAFKEMIHEAGRENQVKIYRIKRSIRYE